MAHEVSGVTVERLRRELYVSEHMANRIIVELQRRRLLEEYEGRFVISNTASLRDVRLTAVEVKLKRWREALAQAQTYSGFADRCIVVLVGQTSFTSGTPAGAYAADLYTLVRRGELFACNKGPDRRFPGYVICPDCGRALDAADPKPHQYPADVPPHRGYGRGPRAGQWCPNRTRFDNQVILGHRFVLGG